MLNCFSSPCPDELNGTIAGQADPRPAAWESLLSDALYSALTMPFEAVLPQGYNNLRNALRSGRFDGCPAEGKGVLNMNRFRRYCFEFYGKEIGEQYFSHMRIFRWDSSQPERYVLLTVLAGITVEDLFGAEIQPAVRQRVSNQNKRTESFLIKLTAEEKECIAASAAKYGGGRVTAFAREVLIREADRILEELSCERSRFGE